MTVRSLLLCCLAASVLSVSAQKIVLHAGGGWASHYGGSSKLVGAFNIGCGMEWELNQHWAIEPGILYSAKGWKDHDQTITLYDDQGQPVLDNEGNLRTAKMGMVNKTNYIVIPLLVHYYIPLSLPHYVYLSAGPYVAYGIGGKSRTSGDTSQMGAARFFYDKRTFSREGMHHFDTGISIGMGYEFNQLINAGIQGDIGLANVTASGRKNYSIMLTLGYRIAL